MRLGGSCKQKEGRRVGSKVILREGELNKLLLDDNDGGLT
jgi:hypothetical protein